ncbi:hypothetical protein RU88_GL001813 [Lactococcus raffinolactis]|nr:hypothetical protein RU88_GL001813 [Lactococcus raffinolactis]
MQILSGIQLSIFSALRSKPENFESNLLLDEFAETIDVVI